MTDTDNTEADERAVSRRDALKGGMLAVASAIAPSLVSQPAMAQTTSPRIQLGQDWVIDDPSDGNGNDDLVMEHDPSGAELRYDVSEGAWIPNQPIGTGSDRVNIYGNTVDANSVSTDDASIGWPVGERVIKTTEQTISGGNVVPIDWDSSEDDPNSNWDIANNQYVVPSDGDYLVVYSVRLSNLPTGRINADVQLNGSSEFGDKQEFSSQPHVNISPLAAGVFSQISAGDTIQPTVFIDSGYDIVADASSATYCSVSKMG